MALRDLYSNLGVQLALETQTFTADGNGNGIDTRGFDSVMLAAAVGISGDTLSGTVMIELEVEESDDDSIYTDVADDDLLNFVAGTNGGTFAVVDDAAEDDAVYLTGYRGSKRYVRVVVNVTGTHTNGTPIGAVAILGHAHLTPVNATS